MFTIKRFGATAAVLGLVAVGVTAMPGKADAWWRGGYCCGVGIGVVVPPIVVAPGPVYAPPPAYYAPPPAAYYPPQQQPYYAPPQQQQGTWIPGHYEGGYWVAGHWA
jgi:hypothetical protein